MARYYKKNINNLPKLFCFKNHNDIHFFFYTLWLVLRFPDWEISAWRRWTGQHSANWDSHSQFQEKHAEIVVSHNVF